MDTHKTWIKPSLQTVELFNRLTLVDPEVKQGKLFGAPNASINGNMFAWVHDDRISLRLPQAQREKLIEEKQGEPLDPSGRRMREYCMLNDEIARDEARAQPLVQAAFAYAASLLPKTH